MSKLRTLNTIAHGELIVEKSRFIARLVPMRDAAEVSMLLAECKSQYPKANHICYAYILGANFTTQKFSDAGEPSGTAGLPMLNILKHEQLTNLIAIVIRYFGGIKLGTGGLARAYADALKAALGNATIQEKSVQRCYRCQCSYPQLSSFKNLLNKAGATLHDIDYGNEISLSFFCNAAQLPQLHERLNQLCGQAVSLDYLGEEYL